MPREKTSHDGSSQVNWRCFRAGYDWELTCEGRPGYSWGTISAVAKESLIVQCIVFVIERLCSQFWCAGKMSLKRLEDVFLKMLCAADSDSNIHADVNSMFSSRVFNASPASASRRKVS